MGIFSKVFGSYSTRELARIEPLKKKVLELDEEYQALSDTVFRLAGKLLKGIEPEGSYEEMGAALPLTDAETAAKILLGEAE